MSLTAKAFAKHLTQKTLIIAEISCNHAQQFDLAVKSVEAIARTGADAVKMQVYTPDTITFNSKNRYFQIKNGTLWDGMTLHDLYQEAYTPWDWFPKLQKIAHKHGLFFFASAFDPSAVAFLEKLKVPAHKVASFEIRDLPLIRQMARAGKPMLMSTGIAEKEDIAAAVQACRDEGNHDISILKCTSEYPTPLEDVNLSVLTQMAKDFNVKVGLSDHTTGTTVPIAAVAMGACIVEKHFILDKSIKSHDLAFSLDVAEFTELVTKIRETEIILGKPSYTLTAKQKKGQKFGRSLFVVKDIKAGEKFTAEHVRSIRPSDGLHPNEITKVLKKKATKNIKAGTPLSWKLVA